MRKAIAGNAGMTLVEVLLALGIFSVMLVSTLAIISSSMRHVYSAGQLTNEVFEAQTNISRAIVSGRQSSAQNGQAYIFNITFRDSNNIAIATGDINGVIVDCGQGSEGVSITAFIPY